MSKLTDLELHSIYSKAFSEKSSEGIVTASGAALRAIESAANEPLLQRIAELERQLEEARKDAERYRWLRLKIYIDPKELISRVSDTYLTGGTTVPEMLDAAIDAAMQKGQS